MAVSLPHDQYPQARRDDSVVDDFHGIKVTDAYRWLEDPNGKETEAFVDDLNKISVPFLEKCEAREKIRERLTKLWDHEKYSCTSKHGQYYFYSYNTGLQNQSVYFIADAYDAKGRVLLDPNTLSDDGTTHVKFKSFTEDGTIMAYGLSEKGSDWTTVKFMKIPSGDALDDVLTDLKFSGVAWTIDKTGIFYSRYPNKKTAMDGTAVEKDAFHSLYYHKMGTPQMEDILVAQWLDEPDIMVSGHTTDDGDYLILDVSKGCDPYNLLYAIDLKALDNKITERPELIPIVDTFHAKYEVIDNNGDDFLVLTNHEAPMFKLIKFKLSDKEKKTTVIAEDSSAKLDWLSVVGNDKLIVSYMRDVKDELYVYSYTGERIAKIPLEIGSVGGYFGRKKLSEFFYSFDGFTTPGIVYRADVESLPEIQPKEFRRTNVEGFDPTDIVVKQEFFTSKDGTKVPMYIVHSKSVDTTSGEAPTILYAYGGFNIPIMPHFSVSRAMFLRNLKGVYVLANIRGGSEYGEKWHEGGMKANKQNVFDDFIGAAEHLIKTKVTKPSKLAIQGGSNGGLLVSACALQRPDLYGAVVDQVGVHDMLRFHKFTIGAAWLPEFGNPDEKTDFPYLYKYSPLHNIRMPESGQLPSMLLCTADHDDRVVPLHTLKFMATLYHMVTKEPRFAMFFDDQTNPLLARIEVKAGHGAGKPTAKVIAELVDTYSFLYRVLDLHWHDVADTTNGATQ